MWISPRYRASVNAQWWVDSSLSLSLSFWCTVVIARQRNLAGNLPIAVFRLRKEKKRTFCAFWWDTYLQGMLGNCAARHPIPTAVFILLLCNRTRSIVNNTHSIYTRFFWSPSFVSLSSRKLVTARGNTWNTLNYKRHSVLVHSLISLLSRAMVHSLISLISCAMAQFSDVWSTTKHINLSYTWWRFKTKVPVTCRLRHRQATLFIMCHRWNNVVTI